MRIYCNVLEAKFMVIVQQEETIKHLIVKIKDTYNSLAELFGHDMFTTIDVAFLELE
jgi:hypothetical protein